MKKILLSALCLLPFFAYAQDVKKHSQPQVTKDANILDVTTNRTTTVKYETPRELKAQVTKEAYSKKWKEDVKKQELAKVPVGGMLVVDISRYTVDAVDTKLFTVLVLDANGQEKIRTKIEGGIVGPAVLAGVSGFKNTGKLILSQPLKTGEMVCVLDEKENKRYEFLVKND